MKAYDRGAAVEYARRWALGRNPAYYDYSLLGGDCTNFASQCLYAGAGVMDFRRDVGWYYRSANDKAPAWTGVNYFYNYLTRRENTPGPFGHQAQPWELEPGDFVQLQTVYEDFHHNPVILSVGQNPYDFGQIKIAAHSSDVWNVPLSVYPIVRVRFLHVDGVRS